MNTITFTQYLVQQGHTSQTVQSYAYHVAVFLAAHPTAETYRFKDISGYLSTQAKTHQNINYRIAILASIKRYYDYLIAIGKRNDHPCRRIFLKGNRRGRQVIHADLFSSEELEQLMTREDRYADLKLRNQVVCSLLIYQALTPGEIHQLKTSNIDLDMARIYSKGTKKIGARHLELHHTQYRLFDKYLHEGRPRLKRKGLPTDRLVLGKLGTPMTVDDINYVISTFKPLFPDRNLTSKTIRQSVIANLLNERKMPLEQVQLWAGHKWISSTVAYRQTSVDEKRELINRFHPLG